MSISDADLTPKRIQEQGLRATYLSEYLPIWVKEQPSGPVPQRLSSSRPDAEIQPVMQTRNHYIFSVATSGGASFTANLYYFPGWKVYVNDNEVQPRISRQGLMQFSLPEGQFRIELKFENTPIRILGNGLSLAGLLALGWMLLRAARASRAQPCQ